MKRKRLAILSLLLPAFILFASAGDMLPPAGGGEPEPSPLVKEIIEPGDEAPIPEEPDVTAIDDPEYIIPGGILPEESGIVYEDEYYLVEYELSPPEEDAPVGVQAFGAMTSDVSISLGVVNVIKKTVANVTVTLSGDTSGLGTLSVYLNVDGQKVRETTVTNGQAVLRFTAQELDVPVGFYDICLEGQDGVLATTELEIINTPAGIWAPTVSKTADGLVQMVFADYISAPSGLSGKLTVNGAAYSGYIRGDNRAIIINYPYDDLFEGSLIKANTICYTRLYPSYTFNFSVTYYPLPEETPDEFPEPIDEMLDFCDNIDEEEMRPQDVIDQVFELIDDAVGDRQDDIELVGDERSAVIAYLYTQPEFPPALASAPPNENDILVTAGPDSVTLRGNAGDLDFAITYRPDGTLKKTFSFVEEDVLYVVTSRAYDMVGPYSLSAPNDPSGFIEMEECQLDCLGVGSTADTGTTGSEPHTHHYNEWGEWESIPVSYTLNAASHTHSFTYGPYLYVRHDSGRGHQKYMWCPCGADQAMNSWSPESWDIGPHNTYHPHDRTDTCATHQNCYATRTVKYTGNDPKCKDCNPDPVYSLSVSPTSWNPNSVGQNSGNITVTSNTSWTISDNATWVSTSKTSGSNNGTFTITVDRNTSSDSRRATVTVTGGGITRTISVTQEGLPTSPQPPTYTIRYFANGTNVTSVPADQTQAINQQVRIGGPPIRPGYTFLGWALSSGATAAGYQAGEYYRDNKDVNFYAVWRAIPKINSFFAYAQISGLGIVSVADVENITNYKVLLGNEVAASGSSLTPISKVYTVTAYTTSGTYDVAFSVSNGGSWVNSNIQRVKLPGTKVNFRVLYHDSLVDSIGSETEAAAYARGVFADAAQAFRNTWGLHFVSSISKAPQIFTVDDCPYRYNKSCNTSPPPGGGPPEPPCPSMSGSCTYCDNKHRCVSRLFNEVVDSYKHRPSTSYDMTTLFFAFNTDCPSLGGEEYSVVWLKDTENYDDPPYPAPGHYSRAEQLSYLWNVRRLQHEISHCFGCLDNDETNPTCVDRSIERCLFNTGYDAFLPDIDNAYNYNIGNLWCSNCRQRFNKNKFN